MNVSRLHQEITFAVLVIALGVAFFCGTLGMPSTAALFPRILVVMLTVLAVLMIMQSARHIRPKEAEEQKTPVNIARLVVFFLLCVAYVGSVEFLGYFFATPVFILVTYGYLRSLSFVKSVVCAALFSGFIYALFVSFLHLPVPLGLLEKILEG